jgi:hypothetical protein
VPDRRKFVVELVDAPGTSPVPVYRRLAQVLKALGRRHGFKCTSAVEVRAEADATPAGLPGEPSEVER